MQPEPPVPPVTDETAAGALTREQAEQRLRDDLELRGTVTCWSNPADSWAVILVKAEGGASSHSLVAPDDQPAGHRVLSIQDQRVRFSVDGTEAELTYSDDSRSWGAEVLAAERFRRGGAPSLNGVAGRSSGDHAFVALAERVNAERWFVSAAEAAYVAENPHRLLREVAARPHRGADGALDGVELSDIDSTSLVAKRGFESRDVIKSVNGESLGDLRTAPSVLTAQSGKRTIVVVYLRRGVEHTVTFSAR